jgi:hypothetical protein
MMMIIIIIIVIIILKILVVMIQVSQHVSYKFLFGYDIVQSTKVTRFCCGLCFYTNIKLGNVPFSDICQT